jgi:hypothetical protein
MDAVEDDYMRWPPTWQKRKGKRPGKFALAAFFPGPGPTRLVPRNTDFRVVTPQSWKAGLSVRRLRARGGTSLPAPSLR